MCPTVESMEAPLQAPSAYPHLRPKTAQLVTASVEARKEDVKRPRWIGYPAAAMLLEEIEGLMRYPKDPTMPNLMIVAPSRNGKSSIVKRIRAAHPPERLPSGKLGIPVVHFNMPSLTREKDVYLKFLKGMQTSASATWSTTALRAQIDHVLGEIDCRLLVIDEFHNLLTAAPKMHRGILGMLKDLSNDLEAPMLCLGTPTCLTMLSRHPELFGRFEVGELPLWNYDDTFTKFLSNLERTLPFPEPSNLAGPEMSRMLYELSGGGVIGWMIRRLQVAATAAIDAGSPCIKRKHFDAVRLRSPDEMRRVEAVA